MDGLSPAGRLAAKIAEKGAAVVLRRLTRTDGPTPLVNPPETADLMVDGDWPAGSTAIALRSDRARGRLVAGDVLLLPGEAVVVAAPAPARAGKPSGFDAVQLQAPTTIDLVDGTFVPVQYAADLTVHAMITSFSSRLVDGDRIRATDLAVTISAHGLPKPETTWQIWFAGRQFSIESAMPTFHRADVVKWVLQAR